MNCIVIEKLYTEARDMRVHANERRCRVSVKDEGNSTERCGPMV